MREFLIYDKIEYVATDVHPAAYGEPSRGALAANELSVLLT